ncbi:2-isopropylmalate synthase, partial [Francisella tularensis subsp. holarctica]|nr:2-isopropylmalate synthase [Francisella tularensis subsp. holarctica]
AIDYGKSNGETYVDLKGRVFGNTDYRITDRGENSALSALLKGIQEYI